MMIRFSTETTTFATLRETAIRLLKLAGLSGTIPTAIAPSDLDKALRTLRENVAAATEAEQRERAEAGSSERDEEEEAEVPVSTAQRAFAFIQLLEEAARAGAYVRVERD